jgi:DNA modification methylase
MTATAVASDDAYEQFVQAKAAYDDHHGFDLDAGELHPILKPHQADLVRWAIKGGRRAVFAAFGLGKSIIQLEILRQVLARVDGPGLIVCPLGVRSEIANDATKLSVTTRFIRRADEIDPTPGVIHLTNYETVRDGKLDPALFTAISLDEAGVLRSYGSKTSVELLDICSTVPYRFVATATPSPNRYKELLHYAEFLGVMDTGQALTRWFKRDSQKAGNLTLFPHKEAEFWLWVSSWAVFLQRPSDLGHDDTGYEMPDLDVAWHEVPVDHLDHVDVERDGQARLYRGGDLGVVQAAREKRLTLDARVERLMAILRERFGLHAGSIEADGTVADQVVIWCDLNDEQRAIEKALADVGLTYSSVHGSLTLDETERRIADWKARRTFALIGKPVMLGQGLNLQQCNTAVFVGITHKFNDLIQACHRIQRYGQTRPCTAHIIYADSEREVRRTLLAKWANHRELTDRMSDLIQTHGLSRNAIEKALARTIGVDRIEASGDGWLVANNDTVPETTAMDDNSVDLVVTSIPFANHYEYTPSYNDFGHTDDNDHFWGQMDYLTPQLLRTLKPGRIYACHVKDRIVFGNMTGAGYSQVSPFHAEAIMHNRRHGFEYMGMITVVTDVVRENNQSYRLGWSENAKDSSKMGVGSPEYILLFRKPQTDRTKGYADTPVTKDKAAYTRARWQTDAHAFWRSSGNRHLTPAELAELPAGDLYKIAQQASLHEVYSYETHVRIGELLEGRGALPSTFMLLAPASWHPEVWHDINRMATLNTDQARRVQEQHVCPLQFDIVDRLIERYSNPGDLVYDPFGGLFTVPVRALHLGRRGRAVELNPGYFADGVKYLQAAERQVSMPTLFDIDQPAPVP